MDDLIGVGHLAPAHAGIQRQFAHACGVDGFGVALCGNLAHLDGGGSGSGGAAGAEPLLQLLAQDAVGGGADIASDTNGVEFLDQVSVAGALEDDLGQGDEVPSAAEAAQLQTGGGDGLVHDLGGGGIHHGGAQEEVLLAAALLVTHTDLNVSAVGQDDRFRRGGGLGGQIAAEGVGALGTHLGQFQNQFVAAVFLHKGGQLHLGLQSHGGGVGVEPLHGDVHADRCPAGGLAGNGAGDAVILVGIELGHCQKLRLGGHGLLHAVAVLQEELPALPDAVALIALTALLAPHGIDGVDRLLVIAQAQGGAVALQRLKPLHRGQLAHHGAFHRDLMAVAVQRHAGVHHDGQIVQTEHAKAADDAAAEHHLVQKAAFVAAVALFCLKISGSQQFSYIISIALEGQHLVVSHEKHHPFGWFAAAPAGGVRQTDP